jgi:hypothetical protein
MVSNAERLREALVLFLSVEQEIADEGLDVEKWARRWLEAKVGLSEAQDAFCAGVRSDRAVGRVNVVMAEPDKQVVE